MPQTPYLLMIGGSPPDPWQVALKQASVYLGILQIVEEIEALKQIRQRDYRVIIIDAAAVKEPFLLTERIRKVDSSAKIVIATVSPTWRRARKAFQVGATDYIHKSMNVAKLLAVLQAAIDQKTTTCRTSSVINAHIEEKEKEKMKRQILFIDNDVDFLDTRGEHLERANFTVFKAISSDEAKQILQNHWIQLMVIDLRLRDDTDKRDITGLILAKKQAYRSIPKIILTRYPSYEHVREALGPALDGLPPAVAFLHKKEGAKATVQAVQEALAKYVPINDKLNLHWQEPRSSIDLASLIAPEEDRANLPAFANELDDLLRILFNEYSQINVNRLYTQAEKNRATFSVFAFSQEGLESQFVVTCGQRDVIQAEAKNLEKFAPKTIGEGCSVKEKSAETVRFAAIAYKLIGGDLEEMMTLAEFYQRHPAPVVNEALDYLFKTTLAPWHQQRITPENSSLKTFFLSRLGILEKITSPLFGEQIRSIYQHGLMLDLPETSHLIANLARLTQETMPFNTETMWGITHGHLNRDDILVDQQGRTWLINFSQVGPAPLLLDFVTLETTIKVELLSDLNIQARYQMGRQESTATMLNEPLKIASDLPKAEEKAYLTINQVRQAAAEVIGPNLEPYQMGLLFCALKQITSYHPETYYTRSQYLPYLQSLISVACISQKLIPPPPVDLPAEARQSLWINEDSQEVWVEGKLAKLTKNEYKLLLYLYHHQERICTYNEITKHVFDVEFGADMSEFDSQQLEKNRCQMTAGRLRKKIWDTATPYKYILTISGEGYRLKLPSQVK